MPTREPHVTVREQPRARNASDEMAARTARALSRELAMAGFEKVRMEQLPLEPVKAVCCLGIA